MSVSKMILPEQASNEFRGGRIPIWGFCLMLLPVTFRSMVHFLKGDSGSQLYCFDPCIRRCAGSQSRDLHVQFSGGCLPDDHPRDLSDRALSLPQPDSADVRPDVDGDRLSDGCQHSPPAHGRVLCTHSAGKVQQSTLWSAFGCDAGDFVPQHQPG